MKTRLLILTLFGILSVNAQTTHNLDWFTNIGTNVDLTIASGDTVIWTWTSPSHTVENDTGSAETFNSGFLGPIGSTFSHTFTAIGSNPYFCGIHGAASMSGTITVEALSIDEFRFANFSVSPNPVSSTLNVSFPENFATGSFTIYDITGKLVLTKTINSNDPLEINVSNWNKGIYLVKVISEKSTQTKRIIIQ